MRYILNGIVLILGLGLGYFAYRVSAPPSGGGIVAVVATPSASPAVRPTVASNQAVAVPPIQVAASVAGSVATATPVPPAPTPVIENTPAPATPTAEAVAPATEVPAPVTKPAAPRDTPSATATNGVLVKTVPTAVPTVYHVKQGDTLFSIAKHVGVSVDAIVKANQLTDKNRLKVGQALLLP